MIRVTLGTLARSGVESYFGDDVPRGVRTAVVYYAHRLRAECVPLRPPAFAAAEMDQPGSDPPVETTVDAEDEEAFAAGARAAGTTVEQLALHAVLLYLAELEALGVDPGGPTGES